MITNDVLLKVRAIATGVDTKGYGSTETYSGIKYIEICSKNKDDIEMIDKIYNLGLPPEKIKNMFEGEYLIIIDNYNNPCEGELYAIFVMTNGKLELVNKDHTYRITNSWTENKKGINPRNPEQICLFNALNDKEKNNHLCRRPMGNWKKLSYE